MRQMIRGWGLVLALCLAGCAAPPAPSLGGVPADAVFADSGQQGKRAITVTLLTPQEGAFKTQAKVHRWVDADIFQYEVTLKIKSGETFSDLPSPLTVVVPRKGTPKTKAVFTNLRQGSIYQVSVTAKGNVGGKAPEIPLNAIPATALFDFSATQDVEDQPSADLRIVFDAVEFNGGGTTILLPPEDGSYRNPSAPETGSAQ